MRNIDGHRCRRHPGDLGRGARACTTGFGAGLPPASSAALSSAGRWPPLTTTAPVTAITDPAMATTAGAPGAYVADEGYGGCVWQRQRFWDGYGWRIRRVRVCG